MIDKTSIKFCHQWSTVIEKFWKVKPAYADMLDDSYAGIEENALVIFTPNRFFMPIFKQDEGFATALKRIIFDVLGEKYSIKISCTTEKPMRKQIISDEKLDFVVFGTPVGKSRPKFSTRNGRAVAYTPPKTRNYEMLVQKAFREQCGPILFEDNPLKVQITAYFPIPTRTPKSLRHKMLCGEVRHTSKPDSDNVAKSVLDALNCVAFRDDSQVCELSVSKFYDDDPRVEVAIEALLKFD